MQLEAERKLQNKKPPCASTCYGFSVRYRLPGIECHHIETDIDFGLKAALPETLKHKISSGDA